MKTVFRILLLSGMFLTAVAAADCLKDQHGNVVCGKGQCDTDIYGKVFCASAGGGAMREEGGKVQCGVGYCAKDDLGKIWCSKEAGGSAAVDSYGKVKCLGGCDEGSANLCREAQ